MEIPVGCLMQRVATPTKYLSQMMETTTLFLDLIKTDGLTSLLCQELEPGSITAIHGATRPEQ